MTEKGHVIIIRPMAARHLHTEFPIYRLVADKNAIESTLNEMDVLING